MSPQMLDHSDMSETMKSKDIKKKMRVGLLNELVMLEAEQKKYVARAQQYAAMSQSLQSENIIKKTRAGLLDELEAEAQKCEIRAHQYEAMAKSLQNDIGGWNVVFEGLEDHSLTVDPDATRFRGNSNLEPSSETLYEHAMRLRAMSFISDFQRRLTWQEQQDQPEANQSVSDRLPFIQNSDMSMASSDEEECRLRDRPSSGGPTDCRITDRDSRILNNRPMIITNDPPEAHEILEPIDMMVWNVEQRRKVPRTALRDIGALVNAGPVSLLRACGLPIPPRPREVRPFGGPDLTIKAEFSCFVPVQFPGFERLCWIEMCAFPDDIMEDNQFILSVKTCLKAGLIPGELTNHKDGHLKGSL